MYKVTKSENVYGESYEVITKTDGNGVVWTIPADENNSDYQAYLSSLETTEQESI